MNTIEEKTLKQINSNLSKINSYKRSFAKGLVTGLGTALGATIVTGIIFSILASTLSKAENIPLLNNIIKDININNFVQQQ